MCCSWRGGDKSTQDRDIREAKALARLFWESIMGKPAITRWDPAEHFASEDDMAAYLEAALEDGDPAVIAAALGDIARAKGMAQIAREAGLGRESLYKALSPEGNPAFATIMKVISVLGLQLHVSAAGTKAAS